MNSISQKLEGTPGFQKDSAGTLKEGLHSLLNEALTTIKATGGSVMLLDSRREWLVIHARLGPPRPGRHREPRFKVDDSSIAGYVASTGRSYRCPDVEKDPHFARSRSGQLHFRSVLCVPILAAEHVLGVVNADHENSNFFSEEDELRLLDLAKRLSGYVIERERLWLVLDSLHNVGASLASLSPEAHLIDVLKNIASQALKLLGADLVTLYQYDQGRQLFLVEGTGPTIAGKLFVPGPMRTRVYPDDVPWKIVKQGQSRYLLDVEHNNFLIGKVPARDGLPERPRFAVRENIKSVAALVLRAGNEIVGVMFANYRSFHIFAEDEKRILETFANSAAIAIKNARLLEELKQIRVQRLAAERWATLGQTVITLAHRINNTAGVIPVAVQDLKELLALLSMTTEQQEQIDANLKRIERNTRFTLELADVLLKPFREGLTAPLNVNELLRKAVDISALPRRVSLDLALNADLPSITSSHLLIDVFVELIANANKAMPHGGRLEIGTRRVSTDWIEIWFKDEGVGISPEHQKKVFNLFFTTRKDSLGFGLWWVNTFILQHGGILELNSLKGQGTTFTIRLPIHYIVEHSRSSLYK